MSVYHKVFVACDINKAIPVYEKVRKAIAVEVLNIRNKLKIQYATGEYTGLPFAALQSVIPAEIFDNLKYPVIHASSFDYISLEFGFGDKIRTLGMTSVCSCDYSDVYDGDKIIFHIASWGNHEAVMDIVKKALLDLNVGDVYECDDAKNPDKFTKVEK